MSDPIRYRIADNQVQRVYGGNILVVDPAGPLVEYADYARLRMERIHDLNQIGGLQEDYARLLADHNKTEEYNEALCERLQDLNSEVHTASCHNANMHKENARLKAEVENSNRINTELLLLSNQQASEVRRLKAEVERLTKLCQATSPDGFIHIRDINAAKEGKP